MDQSSLTEMAVTSLDWCARSTPVTLLKSMLAAQFSSPLPVTHLQQQRGLVLRHAVVSGSVDTVTSLLQHVGEGFLLHSEEQTERSDGRTDGRTRVDKLLGLAVEQGHKEMAEVLLAHGAKANSLYRGRPMLHLSCRLGHQEVAMLLLDHGSDVNGVDNTGETALFAALAFSSGKAIGVIERLLREGANPEHQSTTGRRPVHCAALSSNTAVLQRLLAAGCDVNARDNIMGDTPLHGACARCCDDVIVVLVQHGADVNAANHAGETPLRKLLQHGARWRTTDFHARSRRRLARTLIKLGFRLNSCSQAVGAALTSPQSRRNSRDDAVTCSSLQPAPSIAPAPGHRLSACDTLCQATSSWTWSHSDRRDSRARDKAMELYEDLRRDCCSGCSAVPSLQHLSRMEVRQNLPSSHFRQAVVRLELSFQMQQFLMFEPLVLEDVI